MRTARLPAAVAAVLLAACASAGDRLEEGIRLQGQGRYLEAAFRYADAVDKDETLAEARTRLRAVGDTAIRETLAEAERLGAVPDPLAAADRIRELDRLLSRVRELGVQLAPSRDYDAIRRAAFDDAIEALMAYGDHVAADGRHGDARSAFRRARSEYDATPAQRDASYEAETDLLLEWAGVELEAERYREAFARAGEAAELRRPVPGNLADAVERIQRRALDLGTVRLAVLPITSTAAVRERVGADLEGRLSDHLELDYWRRPPPFIAVADPVTVRREARALAPGGGVLPARDVSRLLDRVGAHFGALIEVVELRETEEDVETNVRQGRTRDGRQVPYQVSKGRLVLDVRAQVIVVDPNGREVSEFTASARESGPFERGSYRGDVRELDLGRNEARLFDSAVHDRQRGAVVEEIVAELARGVAERAFERVLTRVR